MSEHRRGLQTGSGSQWSGRVVEFSDSSLVVVNGRGGTRVFLLDSVHRVEARVPRSRGAGALRGGALGTAAGAVSGAVVWGTIFLFTDCVAQADGEGFGCMSPGEAMVIGGLIGAPYGALLGGVAGFFFPGERWASAPVRPRMMIESGGRVALGMSFSLPRK
jgi:hypothetical protein